MCIRDRGPVGTPTLVNTENDLLNNFGKPYSTDKQYETWLTASSYLAYGGILNVVRADDAGLYNAFVGAATSTKIKSLDHYEELGYDVNTITNVTVAAKNPGTWSNGIRIGIIDGKADQNLTLNSVGSINVGYGITQTVPANTVISKTGVGAGTTEVLDGMFKGIVTGISGLTVDVKFISHVSAAGTETAWDYNNIYKFGNGSVTILNNSAVSQATPTVSLTKDWFDQQELALTTATVGGTETVTTVKWNTVTERPGTSEYVANRGGRFDEVHLVVIDAKGTVTGNAGTILEKHLNLSKAKDAEFSVGSAQYWRKYLETNSEYLFGGSAPVGVVTTGFSNAFTLASDTGWDQPAQGVNFGGKGVTTVTLTGGKNYGGGTNYTTAGAMKASLGGITAGYDLFEDKDQFDIDFLLMGSANYPEHEAQAIANKLISVAELRKDVVAFISPYRGAFLNDTSVGTGTVNSAADITDNVTGFYAPITSTTYAVFDSGYKYMFDRFTDTFRYVPLNGDIAGTCARNDINNFPWFSPAGTARGGILNAVKLAYTPNQTQRDILYSNRINPVIFSPGAGIILFGDKTGFGKASAFDRINVRRLFIFLEEAISAAAKDQLFEFNDEITRTNFVNIVEPFLRDVQSKRGIFDFRVVCDETNNTAAIIDNNEFIADIFIKPSRSINFIGLTFVATRTGISFDEVIGTV